MVHARQRASLFAGAGAGAAAAAAATGPIIARHGGPSHGDAMATGHATKSREQGGKGSTSHLARRLHRDAVAEACALVGTARQGKAKGIIIIAGLGWLSPWWETLKRRRGVQGGAFVSYRRHRTG